MKDTTSTVKCVLSLALIFDQKDVRMDKNGREPMGYKCKLRLKRIETKRKGREGDDTKSSLPKG